MRSFKNRNERSASYDEIRFHKFIWNLVQTRINFTILNDPKDMK